MTITNKSKKEEIFAAYAKQSIELNAAKEALNYARTIQSSFEIIAEYFVEERYVYDTTERMEVRKNVLSYAQSVVLNSLCYSLNLKLNDAMVKSNDQNKKVRAAAAERTSAYGAANFERACAWQERLNLTQLTIKECLEAAEEAHQKFLERPFKRVVPTFQESAPDERSHQALDNSDAIARAKAVGVDVSDVISTDIQLNTNGVDTTDSHIIDQDNNAVPVVTHTDSDPVLRQIAADGHNVKVA
jgi:hypothetical protein